MALNGVNVASMQGVDSAVTPMAIVTVNGILDRRCINERSRAHTSSDKTLYPPGELHNFTVMRHELAFTKANAQSHLNSPSYTQSSQNDLPIVTSFNGMSLRGLPAEQLGRAKKLYDMAVENKSAAALEQLYRFARQMVKFVGINLANINAGDLNRKDSLAIVAAGMMTVINTGTERLGLMERVVWDVPVFPFDKINKHNNNYLPNSKMCAQIVPYSTAVQRNLEHAPVRIMEALIDESDPSYVNENMIARSLVEFISQVFGKSEHEVKDKIVDALKKVMPGTNRYPAREMLSRHLSHCRHVCAEVDDRVIGTSTTAAFPGQMCDVIVRHAM